jgi:hypothetical protein
MCRIYILLKKLGLLDVLFKFQALSDQFAALKMHKIHNSWKYLWKKNIAEFFFVYKGEQGEIRCKNVRVCYVGILQLPIMDFNLINFAAVDEIFYDFW